MHPPLTGLRSAARWATIRALYRFKFHYREARFDMPTASQRLLDAIDVGVRRVRPWDCPDTPVLFFSDHDSVWDGFLLSMVSDAGRDVRRVVFTPTAMLFGREFRQRNITVYPQIVWRKLFFECRSFRERAQYFLTHRPGPFAWLGPFKTERGENVTAICNALATPADVCLLPAGAIGYPRWCTGIGAVVLEYHRRFGSNAPPLMLAPVYIHWNGATQTRALRSERVASRDVELVAPTLVPAARLLESARSELGNVDRRSLTEWLRARYQANRWDTDSANASGDRMPRPLAARPLPADALATDPNPTIDRSLADSRRESFSSDGVHLPNRKSSIIAGQRDKKTASDK